MTLIEELFDLQFPNAINISPNAQQIVYSTTLPAGHKKGDHARSTLWIAETGKPKSSRQLTSGLYNDQAPIWHPDGNSIAFTSDRAKQSESSAIYVLPIQAGGEAYPMSPADNERTIARATWSPRGDFIAYISADEKTSEKKAREKEKDDANVWGEDWEFNRLRLVHVATKKVTTLVNHDGHVADLAWNDDGTMIAFTETRTPHIESQLTHGSRISIIDLSSKAVRELCTFPMIVQDLTWAGDSLYFIGGATPENSVTADVVYNIDLTAHSPAYENYAHGEEDCAWNLQKAGKDVTIMVQHGMESHIRMLKGRTLLNRRQEIDSWDAAFTTDSEEMILAVTLSDSNSPPEVFTTTASGGALVQLSNHGEPIAKRKFGVSSFLSCESHSVKGEESVRLDGIFITPHDRATSKGMPDKPLPTAVLLHGGPYSRNTNNFAANRYMWAPLLLNAGYGILHVNYRGSSGRGEDFAAYCRGGCGVYDYADVIEMTQCAIETGYADKEKLIVGGWSQGGFLSYICSTRNGQHGHGWRFKAAIPGAGVTDADDMTLSSDIGYAEADLAGQAPWKCDKSDTTARTGSAIWEFAAAEKKRIIPPVLILHGEEDKRVALEQAVGFRRALEAARLPFEYVTYPREPHLFKERKHLVDMAERVMRFVDMHIGGR